MRVGRSQTTQMSETGWDTQASASCRGYYFVRETHHKENHRISSKNAGSEAMETKLTRPNAHDSLA
jgi:hypothetical protein